MPTEFPPRLENKFYLTEGGQETEILYKWGFELSEFAMFPLLDNAEADAVIRGIYRRYFDVVQAHCTGLLILGHDYRASPDWGSKLGYSPRQLVLSLASWPLIAFMVLATSLTFRPKAPAWSSELA